MKRFWDAYKSIRKPIPPQTRIERPVKGRGYRRHDKHKKAIYAESE